MKNKHALNGAIMGGLVAIGIPLLLYFKATHNYHGGGASIGLGLLFLAMPVYLPLAIIIGWKIGKQRDRQ